MASKNNIQDVISERRLYRARLIVAALFMLLACGVLIYRYYDLQINQYTKYVTESDRNRIHVQSLKPTRGLITDINGVLLAENRTTYNLTLTRERIKDLDATVEQLRVLLNIDDDDIQRFYKRVKQQRAFDQVPLKFNLSEQEIAAVSVDRYRFPGVEVVGTLTRFYPKGQLYAHAIGYVGRINERDLGKIDRENYAGTNSIGKTGVEYYYEKNLHGKIGYRNVETNVRGRVLRTLDQIDPVPGENIKLYLDDKVQLAAFEAMGDERGSIVALDPKTGGVIAMVSTPSYDPNLFVNGISSKDYNALRDSHDIPLFNRSLQGQYPPGSTVKPEIGLAGLEYGVVTPKTIVRDPGWYQLPNSSHLYRDWKRWGHGNHVDFKQAMSESCDVYYYHLSHKLGIDNLSSFLYQFGIGQYTGIDLPSERRGILPSKQWKREDGRGSWFPGETLNTGIGQGYMLLTPLQLALSTAILANRGKQLVPRMVKYPRQPVEPARADIKLNNPANWDVLQEAMESVIYGPHGTGGRLKEAVYKIAGKSGTAQVVSIAQDATYNSDELLKRQRDHALFVAYAPADDPKIAVAVIVENGEGGGSVAGPKALAVLNAYLLNDEGELRSDL